MMWPALTWQTSAMAWVVLACGVLAILHAAISYARAGHVAPHHWLRVLLLMRLLALLSLMAAAFQPTLSIQRQTPKLARVVIMLDTSRSMGVVDGQWPVSALLQFAEANGQIEPSVRDRPTNRLIRSLDELSASLKTLREAFDALARSRLSGQLDAAVQQNHADQRQRFEALIDQLSQTSAAEPATSFAEAKLKQLKDTLDLMTRDLPERHIEQLKNEARRRDADADEQLVRNDPKLGKIVSELSLQTRLELARRAANHLFRASGGPARPVVQALGTEVSPDKLVDLSADGTSSPLLLSLKQTIERVGARDLQAIVLLSDGRSTETTTNVPPLLSAAGVPVFTVLCAPVDRHPDVRIAGIDLPPTALSGETISVGVHVRSRNADGKPVKVIVTGDKSLKHEKTVTLSGQSNLVRFDIPAGTPPAAKIEARVEPIANERLTENNVASASVTVVDQKINVLLLAGHAGWDVQYLRNILSRTPWVVLQDQVLVDEETKCRFSTEVIVKQDVIILAGMPVASLSAQQIDALHRAVSDEARSVLMLGNDPQTLISYAHQPQLASMLPYRIDQTPMWRTAPANDPTVRPIPSASAQALGLPLLKLDDDPDASLRKWLARPLMYRLLRVGQLKPQASALMIDRSSEFPLIVESAVGSGRALSMLIDETWRWRREVGGDAHDRFWLQLIRHLAEPRYNVSQDALSLGVDRTESAAGQTVDIRARTDAPADVPVTFQLRRGEQIVEQQPARSLLPGSGRWSGSFSPIEPGTYDIVLKAGEREVAVSLVVRAAGEQELADVAPDPALLARIASVSGGRLYSLPQIDQLASVISGRKIERVDTIQYALWCSPYLFGVLVACLGLEWAIRKQIGLV
jgi:hypothetical protein